VVTGLKHQKEKRSMDYFAGLDVSVKETSVCIVAVGLLDAQPQSNLRNRRSLLRDRRCERRYRLTYLRTLCGATSAA